MSLCSRVAWCWINFSHQYQGNRTYFSTSFYRNGNSSLLILILPFLFLNIFRQMLHCRIDELSPTQSSWVTPQTFMWVMYWPTFRSVFWWENKLNMFMNLRFMEICTLHIFLFLYLVCSFFLLVFLHCSVHHWLSLSAITMIVKNSVNNY